MFYSLFLYGIIYWMLKNIPLEIVGMLKWHEYIHNERVARSMRTCACNGEEGVIFLSFWCVCTN